MLPSVLTTQIEDALKSFLLHSFDMSSPLFRREDGTTAMSDFLSEPGNLSKGPYLSINLPFRNSQLSRQFFSHIDMPFVPYSHQAKAYHRLAAAKPESTLIATGTGSGKTECFMYPLLNYCAATKAQGVRAIIIYPMNALATDQAKRFAKTISGNAELKNKVSVGLFIGQEEAKTNKVMGPDKVITCKETLRRYPPDILLTNYKMLDLLLMRPADQSLWQHNDPETLRYIAVDELHTFDGAQGTDLSCLLRRLQHKLKTPPGHIACIGTSATVGDDHVALRDYAAQIFNSPFDTDAVIIEDRLGHQEYLEDVSLSYFNAPAISDIPAQTNHDNPERYINQVITAWFGSDTLHIDKNWDSDKARAQRVALGDALKQHRFFTRLLKTLQGEVVAFDALVQNLFGNASCTVLLESFCALVSVARKAGNEDKKTSAKRQSKNLPRPVLPFLQIRLQMWLRELRRMVASVGQQEVSQQQYSQLPRITYSDDLTNIDDETRYLPIVHCRDCSATGWGGVKPSNDTQVDDDLLMFYQLYFANNPDAVMLFPLPQNTKTMVDKSIGTHYKFCPSCLQLNNPMAKTCGLCEHESLTDVVKIDDSKIKTSGGATRLQASHNCPFCQSENGISVLGSQAASLIGVMSQQLFGSNFNADKQLITFSDSVQDAAHRAGFLTARTYPLMIRSLIAHTVADQADPISLAQLSLKIGQYAQAKLTEAADFVGTYIAPDMEWLRDYGTLKNEGTLSSASDLSSLVCKRLEWEAFSEFGLKTELGRSLEKTRFASVSPEIDQVQQASMLLHAALKQEIVALAHLSPTAVDAFVIGLLHMMRVRGAILHQSLVPYIKQAGNIYALNKIGANGLYMPNFGYSSRKPRFVSIEKVASVFDYIAKGASSRPGEYLQWFNKTIATGNRVLASADAALVFERTLTLLKKHHLVDCVDVADKNVWGLKPEALMVSRDTSELQCNLCQMRYKVPTTVLPHWQTHMPCLVDSCQGHLALYNTKKQALPTNWATADLVRINGHEHTGLLEGPVRDNVERSFINGHKAWDTNLLSATPTLEMGIDIGDLSSVVLCSVPPAQANYLQRIGRAGRRDGNALNITFATGNPHDLYYYADPLNMMSGAMAPPGVFLKALAVLERQLTAFCFDNWVASGIDDGAIPGSVRDLLNAVEGAHKAKFPYNLFAFINQHQGELFTQFIDLFDHLADDSDAVKHLTEFMCGTANEITLTGRMTNRLSKLVADRKSLSARVGKIDREIKKVNDSPVQQPDHPEILDALTAERQGIRGLINRINRQSTLNFFTDEGLLPNYAFPEAGVTIRSILWRKTEQVEIDAGGGKFQRDTYDYERPASAALSELAPENSFYAGGNKVEVEQVDLNVSDVEDWRLCNHCNHCEDLSLSGDVHKTCPKCNHSGWNDSAQKTQMLKLRQVYARANKRDAKISDDSDSRTPKFYKRQMLVDFDPEQVVNAYKIDSADMPFGFDFVRKVKIKDINFGEPDAQAEQLSVAGELTSRAGFAVCKECGMVKKSKNIKHDLTCSFNGNEQAIQDPSNYIDCLYLYRELTSEAIRIVLPVTSYSAGSESEASFAAAIQLGLKKYFKGSIDHIKSTDFNEPINEGEGRRHYLVIYDTIPGGTGYLKELMRDPQNLLRLIQLSYDCLDNCGCNSVPEKNGCYQCIYAYRDRQKMPLISRDRAKSMMQQILENRDKLQSVQSLAEIDPNVLLESELERKFIDKLKVAGKQWRLSKALVNDKNGYLLTVGKQNALEVVWRIEPQVNLDSKDGVGIACKPDFVFWPARTDSQVKPIAVFLDGFEHHYDIVDVDAQKRAAIYASGRFIVWTLGWYDLINKGLAHVKEYLDLFQEKGVRDKFGKQISDSNYSQWELVAKQQNSFELLANLLEKPQQTLAHFSGAAGCHALSWLNKDGISVKHPNLAQKLDYELRENSFGDRVTDLVPAEPFWFGGLLDTLGSSPRMVEIAVSIKLAEFSVKGLSKAAFFDHLMNKIKVHICFDDRDHHQLHYKAALNGYWRLINILQFLPDVSWTTRKAVLNSSSISTPEPQASALTLSSVEWGELLARSLLSGELSLLGSEGFTLAEDGYELVKNDEVIGIAELAWSGAQVALFCADEQQDKAVFEQAGWTCLMEPVTPELIDELRLLISEPITE